MRTILVLLAFVVAASSCSTASSSKPDAEVQSVIFRCGLQGHLVAHVTSDPAIQIESLDPTADPRKVERFFAGVKPLGLDFYFIGNAAPAH